MPDAAPDRTASAGAWAGACELAEVLRCYGENYRRTHRLSDAQRKAMRDIERCRTPALGGHREDCDDCGFERFLDHSGRNRHGPKCQTRQRDAWVGFTLLLHTWDQPLRTHLHLHCLMPAGALWADRARRIAGGRKFLFAVHGLSKMFRAKFLDGLAKLIDAGSLDLPPQFAVLAGADSRRRLFRDWRCKPWVVYSQPPFAGPRKLVEYLGRYTHRVALSNDRILSCDDGQVRFTYRDRRDGDRQKIATLSAAEFIGRFLAHVLPPRLLRVRHYGFLANRAKHNLLARCRASLGVAPPAGPDDRPRTLADWLRKILGTDPTCCPQCGCPLHQDTLPRVVTAPARPLATPPDPPGPPSARPLRPAPWDSS